MKDATIGKLAVNLQYTSRYFHPSRTQPFIVTLFMAVLALKVSSIIYIINLLISIQRVCKVIKMSSKKKISKRSKLTDFKNAIKVSNEEADMTMKGSRKPIFDPNVSGPSIVTNESKSYADDMMNSASLHEQKKQMASSTFIKKIEKRIVEQSSLLRRGKGYTKVEVSNIYIS